MDATPEQKTRVPIAMWLVIAALVLAIAVGALFSYGRPSARAQITREMAIVRGLSWVFIQYADENNGMLPAELRHLMWVKGAQPSFRMFIFHASDHGVTVPTEWIYKQAGKPISELTPETIVVESVPFDYHGTKSKLALFGDWKVRRVAAE